jgi:hypothetical protein
MSERDRPRLWTASGNYFATGEGHSLVAYIGYAVSEENLREEIERVFGEFWANNCDVLPGLIRNDVTEFLWSDKALARLERCQSQAGVLVASARIHVNMS